MTLTLLCGVAVGGRGRTDSYPVYFTKFIMADLFVRVSLNNIILGCYERH